MPPIARADVHSCVLCGDYSTRQKHEIKPENFYENTIKAKAAADSNKGGALRNSYYVGRILELEKVLSRKRDGFKSL